jgi:uncharacterized membrane protein (UPF0127 family)
MISGLLVACNKDSSSPGVVMPGDTWFSVRINETSLQVQLALTPAEQQRGLMYREDLAQDAGMIFAYRDPKPMSFWMANTSIPLDLGIFDEKGTLLEIYQLVPFDTKSVRSRTEDALFAIETNRGWYAANGLYPGAKLDLQLLAKAIRSRGMEPASYRIEED